MDDNAAGSHLDDVPVLLLVGGWLHLGLEGGGWHAWQLLQLLQHQLRCTLLGQLLGVALRLCCYLSHHALGHKVFHVRRA